MAKKISELQTLPNADSGDFLPIVDTSGNITKKVAAGNLLPAMDVPASGIWWEELGRTTLGMASDTITVSSLTSKKYLMVVMSMLNSGQISGYIIFNNDSTAANYNRRVSDNGAADSSSAGAMNYVTPGAISQNAYATVEIMNIAAQNKLLQGHTVGDGGDGVAPTRREIAGQWENNSDAITRIDILNDGTGSFATGSEIIVLGHD